MTWIPNWENMSRKEFSLHYFDDEFDEVVYDLFEFAIEPGDTYRLIEQPLIEKFRWGDLIRAKKIDDANLQFIELLEHAEHTEGLYIMGGNLDSLGKAKFLQKIMDDGGYWQQEMGGVLIIFYPPGKQSSDYW